MQRPIVLGVEGEAAALLQQAGGGICIEPEHPGQLADTVVRLADDEALRKQLGESGCEFITANYDRDQLAMKYLQLLGRLIAGPANASRQAVR